jgi:DNA-binding NtrC family response regulator
MPHAYTTELVGEGERFERLKSFIREAGASRAAVLLLGEPGTGKEATARAIHFGSKRRNQPFVTIDPSLYYEQELERELFGCAEPATDAVGRRGLLEFSSRGTCYIANAEELTLGMQRRLARFLETGTFERVGSRAVATSRARLVLASGKDLRALAQGGLFSEELLGRSSGHVLEIQPLRERPEDIVPFMTRLAQAFGVERLDGPDHIRFTSDAIEALRTYPWPGNFDELKAELLNVFRAGVRRVTRECLSPEVVHYGTGRRGAPEVRKVIEELEHLIEEFRIMVRLDAEYGDVLMDSGQWDVRLKCWDRVG